MSSHRHCDKLVCSYLTNMQNITQSIEQFRKRELFLVFSDGVLGTWLGIIIIIKQNSPVRGLEWPRGFQEVKVPRFHDNGTGWW